MSAFFFNSISIVWVFRQIKQYRESINSKTHGTGARAINTTRHVKRCLTSRSMGESFPLENNFLINFNIISPPFFNSRIVRMNNCVI